jgi:hypothetical protein
MKMYRFDNIPFQHPAAGGLLHWFSVKINFSHNTVRKELLQII